MGLGPPWLHRVPHTFPPKAPTAAFWHTQGEFHFSHSQLYFYSKVASNKNVQRGQTEILRPRNLLRASLQDQESRPRAHSPAWDSRRR